MTPLPRILPLAASLAILPACVTETIPARHADDAPDRMTMVAVGSFDRALSHIDTLAIDPASFASRNPEADRPAIERTIREEIEAILSDHGYELTDPDAAARLVGYAAVLGDPMRDLDMTSRLGFIPGLAGGDGLYDPGTVLVFIVNQAIRKPLWRGAVLAIPDPAAPPDARSQRLRLALRALLSDLPPRR